MATATTVAKGVAEDILYFNACCHGDPAVAIALKPPIRTRPMVTTLYPNASKIYFKAATIL